MNTSDILAELVSQRDRINQAIAALGGMPVKRRGRPPKNAGHDGPFPMVTSNGATAPAPRKKRIFTAKQRREQALRMKKYWREKKKAAKKAA